MRTKIDPSTQIRLALSRSAPLRSIRRLLFAGIFVVLSAHQLEGQTHVEVPAQPQRQSAADVPAAWLGGARSDTPSGAPTQKIAPSTVHPIGPPLPSANTAAGRMTSQSPDYPVFTGKTSPNTRTAAAGEMIAFTNSDGSGSQTITLVHTGKSWMAVYHIDRSGTIRLVSSRPIDADFALQLNATSPLPDDIREMGGQ